MTVGAFQVGPFQANAYQQEAGVLVPDVVGELEADGTTTLQAAGFVVLVFTEYSSVVAAGIITRQDPTGGSLASAGATVTIWVSLGARPQTDGGGWEPFHYYAIRRREQLREANRRKQEAIEEADDDAVQKEIARRLHAELARQDEHDQLKRLSSLVSDNEKLTNAGQKLQTAFLKAKSERTFSRLQALQRELIKAQEEEEMAVLMILLADD